MTSPATFDAIDLFAGPGGWDVAARDLVLRVLGIEFDSAACLTRRAAGLPTIEGDVRDFGPADWPGTPGLIASPPCQTFSMAGKGAGRAALDDVLLGVKTLAARLPFDASVFADDRTGLVLEPLRWALQALDLGIGYEWLAFEQVPTVLPVWEAMAEVLRAEGYSVATGKLYAEQYGVPQTRTRAVLVARRSGEAKLPTPTHSRYYSRTPAKLDEGLLPWVSMAEALGWGMTARPYPTIASARSTGGPDKEKVGGSGARAAIYAERDAGRWSVQNARTNATARPSGEPAPTITGGHDHGDRHWTSESPAPTVAGDPRLAPRGCKHPGPGCCTAYPGTPQRQFGEGTVRVSVEEAAALQTFPPDHPWKGTRSKIFQQIGNAVPPLLARAVLAEVTGRPFARRSAA